MNLIENIEKHFNEHEDYDELTKIRYIYLYICKVFLYDTRFYSRDPKVKSEIYNKQIDVTNVTDFDAVCFSISCALKEILEHFGFKSEIVVEESEDFSHTYVTTDCMNNNMPYKLKLDPTIKHDLARVKLDSLTLGFVDLLRDDFIEKDRARGIFFTQDWVSMPGVIPVASGGIHVWHMPALTEIFGDDSVLQFGGGTLGHPWGNAPGAAANRVALEACVQARNEGRDLAREGNEIIRAACKWSPELAAACEVWKAIKFEFEPVDTIDK